MIFIIFHFSVGSSLRTTIFELLKSLKVNQSKKRHKSGKPKLRVLFLNPNICLPSKNHSILTTYLYLTSTIQTSRMKTQKKNGSFWLSLDFCLVYVFEMQEGEDLGSSRGGQAKFLTHEVGKVMIELYICPLHLSKLKGKT